MSSMSSIDVEDGRGLMTHFVLTMCILSAAVTDVNLTVDVSCSDSEVVMQ